MSFLNLFGSESKSSNTAYNQQTAAQSGGLAVGSGNTGTISVVTNDPAAAIEALHAGVIQSGQALEFGKDVAVASIQSAEANANLSILSNADLVKKFSSDVSDQAIQNTQLLQAVAQNASDNQLAAQQLAAGALQQSFAVSRATAPQDQNFTLSDTFQKIALYGAIAIAAIAALFIFARRRA